MNRFCSGAMLIALLVLGISKGSAQRGQPTILGLTRCDVESIYGARNNLTIEQARARWNYSKRCYPQALAISVEAYGQDGLAGNAAREGDLTQIYPVFGIVDVVVLPSGVRRLHYRNPANWFPPDNPTDSTACEPMPTGYGFAVTCFGGCFAPGQRIEVATSQGIADVETLQNGAMFVLTDGSRGVENIRRSKYPGAVTHVVQDTEAGFQRVVRVKTLGGASLALTPNHPVVTAQGTFVRAGQIRLGTLLMDVLGGADPVTDVSLEMEHFSARNFSFGDSGLDRGLINASGILVGNQVHQQQSEERLGRIMMRASRAFQVVVP